MKKIILVIVLLVSFVGCTGTPEYYEKKIIKPVDIVYHWIEVRTDSTNHLITFEDATTFAELIESDFQEIGNPWSLIKILKTAYADLMTDPEILETIKEGVRTYDER